MNDLAFLERSDSAPQNMVMMGELYKMMKTR